ncbi:MAG: hypothetical protein ACE5ER_13025, partial [Nitrospinaceae bacterium]
MIEDRVIGDGPPRSGKSCSFRSWIPNFLMDSPSILKSRLIVIAFALPLFWFGFLGIVGGAADGFLPTSFTQWISPTPVYAQDEEEDFSAEEGEEEASTEEASAESEFEGDDEEFAEDDEEEDEDGEEGEGEEGAEEDDLAYLFDIGAAEEIQP